MAEIVPRHYAKPYDNCYQCGGQCSCTGSECFGGTCDYRERASSNRYRGYPTRYERYMDQSQISRVRNELPQQCNRVAPNTYALGENGQINGIRTQYGYVSYNATLPTWVGIGRKCGHYPVDTAAFHPNATRYQSL